MRFQWWEPECRRFYRVKREPSAVFLPLISIRWPGERRHLNQPPTRRSSHHSHNEVPLASSSLPPPFPCSLNRWFGSFASRKNRVDGGFWVAVNALPDVGAVIFPRSGQMSQYSETRLGKEERSVRVKVCLFPSVTRDNYVSYIEHCSRDR
jgi:hypothetical protein